MSKLARKFRFEKRNRASRRAGLVSKALPGALADPNSTIHQAVNAVTFSMAVPSSAAGNTATQLSADDILSEGDLGNTNRFLVTRVEDPRVQVVDDQGRLHQACLSPTQPVCTQETSDEVKPLAPVSMQKWLDQTPNAAELEASRDEILEALAFDPEQEENETISGKGKGVDNYRYGLGGAEADLDLNPPEKGPRPLRKRSLSATSSSTLSSLSSEIFYGCGEISPLDEIDPVSERSNSLPASLPPNTAIQEPAANHHSPVPIQGAISNESQTKVERGKGANSGSNSIAPDRKPSIASKLNFKFKGMPIFSSKQASFTGENKTEPNEDNDNKEKARPKFLSSHPSMASIDSLAREPAASFKQSVEKVSSIFTRAHIIFKTSRSSSSHFTPKPGARNDTTRFDMSHEPITVEPFREIFSNHKNFLSMQAEKIQGEEGFKSGPSASKHTQELCPPSEFTEVRSIIKSLPDIHSGLTTPPTIPPTIPNSQITAISAPITPAAEGKISPEPCGNLDDTFADNEENTQVNVLPIHGPSPGTPGELGRHPHSPLFDIRKRSSLTALRIQLDFFNKMVNDIQKKINKLVIYQPTPALLERLRQLKHAHRGIILTLGAAPILEDMKAAGYKGKLLADLEAFQGRLDEYNWEQEGEDPMANPFGLPVEPAWHGGQFEGD
ncbi:unnamed protein product [Tuber aestivum]|uniref:Uncharacterized protein n=1 Tax=Tuber aestivum TaxID=59557 RepID=A0A292PXC8_9PEZI|nr:unnamed protein product [Tuber aestivum]